MTYTQLLNVVKRLIMTMEWVQIDVDVEVLMRAECLHSPLSYCIFLGEFGIMESSSASVASSAKKQRITYKKLINYISYPNESSNNSKVTQTHSSIDPAPFTAQAGVENSHLSHQHFISDESDIDNDEYIDEPNHNVLSVEFQSFIRAVTPCPFDTENDDENISESDNDIEDDNDDNEFGVDDADDINILDNENDEEMFAFDPDTLGWNQIWNEIHENALVDDIDSDYDYDPNDEVFFEFRNRKFKRWDFTEDIDDYSINRGALSLFLLPMELKAVLFEIDDVIITSFVSFPFSISLEVIEELTGSSYSDVDLHFGGKIPHHPMYYSGWRGNIYSNSESTRCKLIPGEINFQELYVKYKNRLDDWRVKFLKLDKITTESRLFETSVYRELRKNKRILKEYLKDEFKLWMFLHFKLAHLLQQRNNLEPDWPLDNWDEPPRMEFHADDPVSAKFSEPDLNSKLNFILEAKGYPLQWSYSSANSNHFQCQNSLCLGPLETVSYSHTSSYQNLNFEPHFTYLHVQRPYLLNKESLIKAGANIGENMHMAFKSCMQSVKDNKLFIKDALIGLVECPDVFSYTSYLPGAPYHDLKRKFEKIDFYEKNICVEYKYGFLALGSEEGLVHVFCMRHKE